MYPKTHMCLSVTLHAEQIVVVKPVYYSDLIKGFLLGRY